MHVTESEEATNAIDASDMIDAADAIDSEDVGNDGGFLQEELDATTTDLPLTETVVSESSSSPAIADDLLNGCSQDTKVENVELDAEMVSEDELPAPAQPTIDDAEDLSDDELPGPKRAELPADTEVVSEDEFPSSNKVKRKADESHETDNTNEDIDTPKKRAKTELDSKYPKTLKFDLLVETNFSTYFVLNSTISDNNREVDIPNNENSDKTIQKKSLPDLDKYWKAVNDDPSDFTAWTYLLQYVEQEVISSLRKE